MAHRLGGRDALDLRGEGPALVLAIQVGTLREEESVQHRIVECRQCMDIDVGGFLAPPEPSLCSARLLKVVLAQIKRDNRRAVFHRRAHTGVLRHLRDRRRKLHRHGHRPLTSFATPDMPWDTSRRGYRQAGIMDKRPQRPARHKIDLLPNGGVLQVVSEGGSGVTARGSRLTVGIMSRTAQ